MNRIFKLVTFFTLFTTFVFAATDVNLLPLDVSHKTTVVTITTSATALPTTPLSGRKSVIVQSIGTATIYIGNVDLTADENATGGYQLRNTGDVWGGDFSDNVVVYGRVATGSQKVVVWEVR